MSAIPSAEHQVRSDLPEPETGLAAIRARDGFSDPDPSRLEASPARDGVPAVVEAEAAVFVRGGRVALSVDRLVLPFGVTALVGPNGSGKSTLLHAITGLLIPASGRLRVLGHAPPTVRRRVAYVLQAQRAPANLPVTVREVVALGRAPLLGPIRRPRPADNAAVDEAIERMELADLSRRHLAELSGGQRQRVFVAQGLAQDADVLLLDEATAGLDLASVERIRAAVTAERDRGRAVLIATHDLAEAADADTAVLLARRVVAAGPPAGVLRPENLEAAYGGRMIRVGESLLSLDDGSHHHTSDRSVS